MRDDLTAALVRKMAKLATARRRRKIVLRVEEDGTITMIGDGVVLARGLDLSVLYTSVSGDAQDSTH